MAIAFPSEYRQLTWWALFLILDITSLERNSLGGKKWVFLILPVRLLGGCNPGSRGRMESMPWILRLGLALGHAHMILPPEYCLFVFHIDFHVKMLYVLQMDMFASTFLIKIGNEDNQILRLWYKESLHGFFCPSWLHFFSLSMIEVAVSNNARLCEGEVESEDLDYSSSPTHFSSQAGNLSRSRQDFTFSTLYSSMLTTTSSSHLISSPPMPPKPSPQATSAVRGAIPEKHHFFGAFPKFENEGATKHHHHHRTVVHIQPYTFSYRNALLRPQKNAQKSPIRDNTEKAWVLYLDLKSQIKVFFAWTTYT